MMLSSRLMLRELTTADVTIEYVEWMNDPAVNRFLESRFVHQDLNSIENYIKKISASKYDYLFGIFLAHDAKHIGNIKVGPVNLYHKRAEVGLIIGDKLEWGKGYATEAIAMVSEFAFNELGLMKLTAGCYESNVGSKKAFEKVGYCDEGYVSSCVETDIGREGIWRLGLQPNELKLT